MIRRILLVLAVAMVLPLAASAQKFALVDMEYILDRIPAYERATEQLNQMSKRWQAEVEALSLEAQNLYKNYQNESMFLSEEQKTKRENEIIDKEKEARELKRKYFDADGELAKKQESLMTPIQDEIYEAVKQISEKEGYQMVIDRSSAQSVIFASPKIDISRQVLTRLGYSE